MTRRYQAFDARSRRNVDDAEAFDERGIVRDGYGLRVPLTLMDSTQRRVAADAKRRKVVERDPMGRVRSTFEEEEEEEDAARFGVNDALALHKPGYRYNTDAAAFAQQRAYAESVQRLCDAWKQTDASPPVGAYPLSGGEGNPCTIDGRPGVLVKTDDGNWLTCRPVSRTDALPIGLVYDAPEGQRIKDAAWRQMCDEKANAWRKS